VTIATALAPTAEAVYIDGVSIPWTPVDAGHLSIVTPAHPSGEVIIQVASTTSPGRVAEGQVWFFYADVPTLITLDPSSAHLSEIQSIDIAITGTGFATARETATDPTVGLYWGNALMYEGHWQLISDSSILVTGVGTTSSPQTLTYKVKTLAGESNTLPFEYKADPVGGEGWPGYKPLPVGRGGFWKLTLHDRAFQTGRAHSSTVLTEIDGARSRRLEQKYNDGATLTFSVAGDSDAAMLIKEFQHDVIAWRFDDISGKDIAVFRGVVSQSQDSLSEQTYTVNFTCHDYLAMMGRRVLDVPKTYTQLDQDTIVNNLLTYAKSVPGFMPGSFLPLFFRQVDPAGNTRTALSGMRRDRTYDAGQKMDEAIINLAACEGGFDFAVVPGASDDYLQVYYPYQGELRRDLILEYGTTVASLSRSVNSTDYANYWRVIGQAAEGAPEGTPPMMAVASSPEANNVSVTPIGLWQSSDNASDVNNQNTLNEKARADLSQSSLVMPSYSLSLRPEAYHYGSPKMGDTVRLIINRGRLKVDTDVRVVGIAYAIGDDGDEAVELEVGRPDIRFRDLFTRYDRDINALARR